MKIQPIKLLFLATAVLGGLIIAGCDRQGVHARTDVIATIGGEPLTQAEIKDAVLIMARIFELSKRPVPAAQFAAWGNSFAARIAPGMIQAKLLDCVLTDEKVCATEASNAKLLAKYNRLARQKGVSYDEMSALFGPLETSFRRQFARESRFEAFNDGQAHDVSESDFAAYYAVQSNLLVRCRKVSEAGWRKARRAHADLKAGQGWENVARRFSEDKEVDSSNADNWKDWITVEVGKLESKDLIDAVSVLKPGEFTAPIDIDEGLVIVRLNAREGETCELSRILIRMGREFEMPDRETAKQEIIKDKRRKSQAALLAKAREKYKIEYPNGTNITFCIWKEDVGNKSDRLPKRVRNSPKRKMRIAE